MLVVNTLPPRGLIFRLDLYFASVLLCLKSVRIFLQSLHFLKLTTVSFRILVKDLMRLLIRFFRNTGSRILFLKKHFGGNSGGSIKNIRRLFLCFCVTVQILIYSTFAEDRSFDGTNNNLNNPMWGSRGSQVFRRVESAYSDGILSFAGANRANPKGNKQCWISRV